jgi:hypothetical protein
MPHLGHFQAIVIVGVCLGEVKVCWMTVRRAGLEEDCSRWNVELGVGYEQEI